MSSKLSKARAGGRVPGYPRLLGGRLCLDLVNTVERRWASTPVDFLPDADALAQWGYHCGALDADGYERLSTELGRSSREAQAALDRAVEVRELTYCMLSTLVTSGELPREESGQLESIIGDSLRRAHLRRDQQRLVWQVARPTVHLVSDLAALDVLDLMTTPILASVKQCPGCDDCGWLFLDTSKNRTRRWCSMEGCGSRAKMRRHYQRTRP